MLRLSFHAVALRSLDGDPAGALGQACDLLAAGRRFLRHDGQLIDKMVLASLTQGAASLVLAIRRADPASPMPGACSAALAPVAADDYRVCNALRAEYEMGATMSRQWDAALAKSWNPIHVGTRWVLADDRLQRGWIARSLAPLCREQDFAAIDQGRLPGRDSPEFSMASVDYWAAPLSNILANISPPSYNQYQHHLLDHAAVLRLQLAAIAHANGELTAAQVLEAGASPGYALVREADAWRLPLLASHGNQVPEFLVSITEAPAPDALPPE